MRLFINKLFNFNAKSFLNVIRFLKTNNLTVGDGNIKLEELLKKCDKKIIYSDYTDYKRIKLGYTRNVIIKRKEERKLKKEQLFYDTSEPLPLVLKYLENNSEDTIKKCNEESKNESPLFLPYSSSNTEVSIQELREDEPFDENVANIADAEIRSRFQEIKKSGVNWMSDYDNYDESEVENENSIINYGTSDPNSEISSTPCGGCGAFLHCKDTSIPGYIPSEIFKNFNKQGGVHLKAVKCQRCHFLKNYNIALQVRVSATDYPKILSVISKRRNALVVLMVDLLNFPCSIWPGIADLIGFNRPIVLVGNKVDLLPQDGKGFLERVKNALEKSIVEHGFGTANIKHIALISSKTGFGVEDLITQLHSIWKYRGDVFLVGCTNVGKSTLFNILLQSDYCKTEAGDLIQRATTSPWPGTTLNLLKFPILRPTGWKLHLRHQRLFLKQRLLAQERKLQQQQLSNFKSPQYASLMGHIDRTFKSNKEKQEVFDPFAIQMKSGEIADRVGIDDKDHVYVTNKWCYDTPGVVQPDQITDLLTTEELVLTFPNRLLKPRTFKLKPESSIFIGGLARLDFLEGPDTVFFTIFCAQSLPVTITTMNDADYIYDTFLGTKLLGVPIGDSQRLKLFPALKPGKIIECIGVDPEFSCIDVVLSNAGWIAVTPRNDEKCVLKAWTPDSRGIHTRESLLPKAVSLRGKKIRASVACRVRKIKNFK